MATTTTTTQQAKELTALTDITSLLFKQWKGGTRVCSMIPQIKQCMEGKGTCIIANGHQFSGNMRNGIMNGKGKIKWTDGTVYEGQIQNNVLKGKGNYTWANGSTYEGDILNGLRHGQGIFKCPVLGVRYEGGWKFGLRHGYGVIAYKDGTIYKGTWQNGKKHGFGTMSYPSGNQYEGNWRNDMKHGKGKMVWKTRNQRYEGGWKQDLQSGYGCHVWFYKTSKNNQSHHIILEAQEEQQQKSNKSNGDSKYSKNQSTNLANTSQRLSIQQSNSRKSLTVNKFDSKYPQGLRKHSFTPNPQASEKRLSPVPNISTNQLKAFSNLSPIPKTNLNKQSEILSKGQKISTPRSNAHNLQLTNRYLGEFREGVRFGQGIFFYSDGSKYEGFWENNVKHGFGVFTFADGDVHQGQFELDHMINPPPKLQSQYNRAVISFEEAKQEQEQLKKVKLQAEKNKSKYGHLRSSRSQQSIATDVNGKQAAKSQKNNLTQSIASNSKILTKAFSIKNVNMYQNPFLQMIDIDDVLQISCVIKPNSVFSEQKKQISNLLLRHISELKKCYRYYTNCIELNQNQRKVVIQSKKANKGMIDQIDEQSCFCMRMRQFWRLLRDATIRSPSISIAQIDRCLAMAKKSKFALYERKKGKNLPVGATQSLGFNYKFQKGQDRLAAQSQIFAPFSNQPDFEMRLQNQ